MSAKPTSVTLKLFSLLVGLTFLASMSAAASYYYARLVYVAWRKHITRHLHYRYTLGRTMYTICDVDGRVDNPDQRIQQDAQYFALLLIQIVWGTTNNSGLLTTLTAVVAILATDLHILTQWGVIAAFSYFLLCAVGTLVISRPIVPLVFRQDRFEGDFRFAHVRARTFAEVSSLVCRFCRGLRSVRL